MPPRSRGTDSPAELPAGIDEQAALAELRRNGVRTQGIGDHVMRAKRPRTLLLGYAALHNEAARAAVERIAASMTA